MHYRMYLLDERKHIWAGESFSADGDKEASTIGASVHSVCNDTFPGYEVWCGTRLVAAGYDPPVAETALAVELLTGRRQESVLDLEERMQRTFLRVQRKRKLLEARSQLRYR
jgi:hypothetical protein